MTYATSCSGMSFAYYCGITPGGVWLLSCELRQGTRNLSRTFLERHHIVIDRSIDSCMIPEGIQVLF